MPRQTPERRGVVMRHCQNGHATRSWGSPIKFLFCCPCSKAIVRTQTITPWGHWVIQQYCSGLYSKKGHLHGFFFNSHSMMTFNKSSYAHCSQVNQFWLGALPSPFSVCARIPNRRSIFVHPQKKTIFLLGISFYFWPIFFFH